MTVWHYPRCYIVNVHDADTIMVDIDCGQDIWVRRRSVRLAGIAARELKDPGGKEARDHLTQLLPVGSLVRIESRGWDKYAGRIDGVVWRGLDPAPVQSRMVADRYAVLWDGKGPQPKPAWPIPTP